MAEVTAAERKELEALRAEKVAREREEQGLYTGEVNCGTLGCDFGRQPAELEKQVIQVENKDLGIVEKEYVNWRIVGDEYCPECEMPLTAIEPNAQSVFPKNYRWVYPKPVQ